MLIDMPARSDAPSTKIFVQIDGHKNYPTIIIYNALKAYARENSKTPTVADMVKYIEGCKGYEKNGETIGWKNG